MTNFPNAQNNPAGAIPVYITSGGGSAYLGTPLGYQQLSVSASAVTFASVPAGATFCVISVENNGVRYRDDGVAPTPSLGMPMLAGTFNTLYSGKLSAIQFIAISGTALVDVSFYK